MDGGSSSAAPTVRVLHNAAVPGIPYILAYHARCNVGLPGLLHCLVGGGGGRGGLPRLYDVLQSLAQAWLVH